MFCDLEDSGLPVKKNTLIRCAVILFFEDISIFRKNPKILQRCVNRFSTDKLLSEICREILPHVKLALKDKKDNRMTTFSTQITPESLKIINNIISSPVVESIFEELEEDGLIINKNNTTLKSIIIRASVCYLLYRLSDLKKNPLLYQRSITLQSSENILRKIYQEKYGGFKN